MALFVTKTEARALANSVDKVALKIKEITNSDIDRLCDKIDGELNSCGRELTSSAKTLTQIKPLVDKLVLQVGEGAPEHLKVLVQSICQEIVAKTASAVDNIEEVKRNIKDIDVLTDSIDKLTDRVAEFVDEIDTLTDAVQ